MGKPQQDHYTVEATALMMDGDLLLFEDTSDETNLQPNETDFPPPNKETNLPPTETNLPPNETDFVPPNKETNSPFSVPSSKRQRKELDEAELPDRQWTNPSPPTTASSAPTYLMITDGSQFRRPFWKKEAASLTKLMDKQRVRHPDFFIPNVPEPEDLQMQFI